MKLFSERLMDEVQEQIKEEKMEIAAYRTLDKYIKDVLGRLEKGVYDPYPVFGPTLKELTTETECILQIGKDVRRIKNSDTTKNIKDILDDTISTLTENGLVPRAELIKEEYKNELFKEVDFIKINTQADDQVEDKKVKTGSIPTNNKKITPHFNDIDIEKIIKARFIITEDHLFDGRDLIPLDNHEIEYTYEPSINNPQNKGILSLKLIGSNGFKNQLTYVLYQDKDGRHILEKIG